MVFMTSPLVDFGDKACRSHLNWETAALGAGDDQLMICKDQNFQQNWSTFRGLSNFDSRLEYEMRDLLVYLNKSH